MSADEQLRRMHQQQAADGRVIFSGITSDVLHKHVDAFHGETVDLRIHVAEFLSVDVAVDGPQGAESCQPFGQLRRTDVARVPDFITVCKVFQVAFVPVAMCV